MLMSDPLSWQLDPVPTNGPQAGLERYTQPILCSLDLSDLDSAPERATHFVEVRSWCGPCQWHWELDAQLADLDHAAIAQGSGLAAQLAADAVVPFMLSWRADVEGGTYDVGPGLVDHVVRACTLNEDHSCTVHFDEVGLARAFSMMQMA